MSDMFIIAENHVPKADIVVSHNASAAEKYAASELGAFLEQVTVARFEINHRPGQAPCHIMVGVDAVQSIDSKFTIDDLGADGVILRRRANTIILAGGRPRGTLYAVYTFLHDVIGCRWWSRDASYIPHKPALTIDTLDICYVPQLNYRHTSWYGSFYPEWAARNRLNGSPFLAQPKYGGNTTHGGVHTFFGLVPPYRHFHQHPEWFSLINGERTPWHSQLCLSNQAMTTFLVRALKSRIMNNLGKKVFSVSQEDWEGNCECENCRKLDEQAGSPAGSLLHFVNKVAAEIEKEYPDVFISTLAYLHTRKPPQNIKPRKNVIIQLCNIECDFSVPLTDERNKSFRDDLIGWSAIAGRLYIWDYTTNFHHYYAIHPNIRVLGPNIRFFAKHNARGIYEQGGSMSPWPEFGELRAWMISRLLWDPSLDDEALMIEFCEGYYGRAGKHIVNYINMIHDGIKRAPDTVMRNSSPTYRFITFDLMNALWNELLLAERAAKADAALSARIERVKMSLNYTFVFNWKRLREQCRAANETWPIAENIQDVADEFIKWAKANEITHIFEWHPGFSRMKKAIQNARIPNGG